MTTRPSPPRKATSKPKLTFSFKPKAGEEDGVGGELKRSATIRWIEEVVGETRSLLPFPLVYFRNFPTFISVDETPVGNSHRTRIKHTTVA